MRKFCVLELRLLAVALAVVLLAAIPALADEKISISNSGDYAEQCSSSQQTSNEGDIEPEIEATQEFSTMDGFEPGGDTLAFEPGLDNGCDQSVDQSSSVGGKR